MKRLVIIGTLLLTGVAVWLVAQTGAPSKPAVELMPAGALFYLETRNFARLVSDWDAAPEKKAWLESGNYQSLLRSHLITRLAEARKSYLDAAGLPEDAPLLAGVAGGESAVAFYHIGRLEFLYITQTTAARFADSSLGKVKQKFQARKAGGRDYFVQTKGESTIAFALVDDRLLVATREDLLAIAIQLQAGDKIATLRQEPWFNDAIAKAPASAPDVRFVADLDRTSRTHQFRSYWIQKNVDEVRQFASEVADLKFTPSEIREDRVFLRRVQQDDLTGTEPVVAELMRYAPTEAGFTQAMSKPTPARVSGLLAEKLFGHSRPLERSSSKTVSAPGAPGGAYMDGEDDYETRVDSPSTTDDSVDAYAPLSELASNVDAMLQTGTSRAGTLVGLDAAVVLHGVASWQPADLKRVLGQVAGTIWSIAPGSLQWADRGNISELNSVTPVRFIIDGNLLVFSSSPEWMARVMATRPAVQGASYAATLRYAQELPAFERMMRLIDYPAIPQGTQADAREPLFFSQNIVSVLSSLTRLESVSVTAHDTGAMVTETVVYRKK